MKQMSETRWLVIMVVAILAVGAVVTDRDVARKHELEMARLKCTVPDTLPPEK